MPAAAEWIHTDDDKEEADGAICTVWRNFLANIANYQRMKELDEEG